MLAGFGDEPSSHWLSIVQRRLYPAGATISVGGTPEANLPGELINIPQVRETFRYISMDYSYFLGLPAPLTNGGLNEFGLAVRDVALFSRRELVEMTPKPQHGLNYSDIARIVPGAVPHGSRGGGHCGGAHREIRLFHLRREFPRICRCQRGVGAVGIRRRQGTLGGAPARAERRVAQLARLQQDWLRAESARGSEQEYGLSCLEELHLVCGRTGLVQAGRRLAIQCHRRLHTGGPVHSRHRD